MTPPPIPEDILSPLDPEEVELLRSFAAGEWQSVPQTVQEIARYAAATVLCQSTPRRADRWRRE